MDSNSPASLQGITTDLKKITSEEWSVYSYRSVEGGGTGEEFTENLQKDGDSPGNKWYDCCSGETWIEAVFHEPQIIKLLQLKSANDCPDRDPYNITFEVKEKPDEKFTSLGNFTVEFENRYEIKNFFVDTIEPVKIFRITINENRGKALNGSWNDGTQLAQVIFYKKNE